MGNNRKGGPFGTLAGGLVAVYSSTSGVSGDNMSKRCDVGGACLRVDSLATCQKLASRPAIDLPFVHPFSAKSGIGRNISLPLNRM